MMPAVAVVAHDAEDAERAALERAPAGARRQRRLAPQEAQRDRQHRRPEHGAERGHARATMNTAIATSEVK